MSVKILSPKFWFIMTIVLVSFLAVSDHLASPPSPDVASQSGNGACAPCGAPCILTEK